MEHWFIYFIPGVVGLIWLAVQYAVRVPGLWQTSSQFNSTSSWTLASSREQLRFPPGTNGLERGLGIVTPRLEAGETLEGFAFGYFFPPRPQDWGFALGPKGSVLVAVTSRRMMLFEFNPYPQVVLKYCFIGYDAIESLSPPKPQSFGTSGPLRFRLPSGLEYQFSFLGPVIYPEFLRQEQKLAEYLRSLAPRLPLSRSPHERRLAA